MKRATLKKRPPRIPKTIGTPNAVSRFATSGALWQKNSTILHNILLLAQKVPQQLFGFNADDFLSLRTYRVRAITRSCADFPANQKTHGA